MEFLSRPPSGIETPSPNGEMGRSAADTPTYWTQNPSVSVRRVKVAMDSAWRADSILRGVYIEYWAHQGPSIGEDGEFLSHPRDAESGRSIRLRTGRSTIINANQCASSRKTRPTSLAEHTSSDDFKISFRVRGGGYLLSFSSEGYPYFPEESPDPERIIPSQMAQGLYGSQYTLDFKGMDRAMEFKVTVTRYEGWYPRGPFALHRPNTL